MRPRRAAIAYQLPAWIAASIGTTIGCAGATVAPPAVPSISNAATDGVVYDGLEMPCEAVPALPESSQRPKMYVAAEPCCDAVVDPPGVHTGEPTAPVDQSVTPMKTMELLPVRVI